MLFQLVPCPVCKFLLGCPPAHYGPLCNRSCPQNCKGPCDLESGICIFGCLNGWTGNTCVQGKTHFHVISAIDYLQFSSK